MLNKNLTGLIVGLFFAIVHAFWSLIVALGFAQLFLDWIYSLHFMNNPFEILNFDMITAVTLVGVTFVCGYLFGWIFSAVFNLLHRRK